MGALGCLGQLCGARAEAAALSKSMLIPLSLPQRQHHPGSLSRSKEGAGGTEVLV